MAKRTHSRRPRTPSHSPPRLSRSHCRQALRQRLAAGRAADCKRTACPDRLRQLLQEEALECPICLQTLLRPVLAECGHLFCLSCADELSRHDFACGMCHHLEPSFEPRVERRFQQLVRSFLQRGRPEERLNYEQRQKALQEKERGREVGALAAGDLVDFWSIEEKCWRSGRVHEVNHIGQVVLAEPKASKPTVLDIASRRLAKHRHFTKEEAAEVEVVEVEASEPVRPSMFGMPFYINFFANNDAASGAFNLDINELLGIVPSFRPFPF